MQSSVDAARYLPAFTRPARVVEPFAWVRHIPFAFFLMSLFRPRVLVELGVHSGNSYNAFCQAAKTFETGTSCYGVDTWKGDPHAEFYDESVYADLAAYQADHYAGFSTLLRMRFDEALASFPDGTVDLLHIDGLHTYEAVRHDFESWLPKLSPRGIILFHDTQAREGTFGVWRLWEELAGRFPSFEFTFGHGLGVLTAGGTTDPDVLSCVFNPGLADYTQRFFETLGSELLNAALAESRERAAGQVAARLFYDTGLGFNDRQSLAVTLPASSREIAFDTSGLDCVKSWRFDPDTREAVIFLDRIEVEDAQGGFLSIEDFDSNAGYRDGGNLVFAAPDPQIWFSAPSRLRRVVVCLEYVAVGEAARAHIQARQTAEAAGLAQEVEALRESLAGVEQRLASRERECASLERAQAALELALSRHDLMREQEERGFRERLDAMRVETDALRREAAALDRERQNLLSSMSWRLMAPARKLVSMYQLVRDGFRGRPAVVTELSGLPAKAAGEGSTDAAAARLPDIGPLMDQVLELRPATATGLVTIVIPIFNAQDHLRRCLASLEKYIGPGHSILAVNDCSTEPGIADLVREFQERMPGLRYFENPENLGFVRTCNRAVFELDGTGNDILLLNSDTELTEGALDELLAVRDLHDRHAVVCPRSNNATIYSIQSPAGLSPQESYALWLKARASLPRFSVMPTGVGFCMLIRREIINNFGLFDEIYGRGYNEENDFVCRINRYGFSSVSANHAFVFHYESKSFGSGRQALESKNRQTLNQRYPEYGRKVREYAVSYKDPMERFSSLAEVDRPRILFDLRELPACNNGTSVYNLGLVSSFSELFSKTMEIGVAINPAAYKLHKGRFGKVDRFDFDPRLDGTAYHLAFKPMQLWDMNHLSTLALCSPRIVFTLQDVIALRCDYLRARDRYWSLSAALSLADHIVSISDYTAKDCRMLFGDIAAPMTTILHGQDPRQWKPSDEAVGDYLLVIGNHYSHKAVRECVEFLGSGYPLRVVGCDEQFAGMKNVVSYKSGLLSDEAMGELLCKARVVLFPSLYEGFGLPPLQAAYAGRPVVLHENELNRELARAGLFRDAHFFRNFSEIRGAVEDAMRCTNGGAASKTPLRSWDDAAKDYYGLFTSLIAQPLDYERIRNRWRLLSAIGSAQRYVH